MSSLVGIIHTGEFFSALAVAGNLQLAPLAKRTGRMVNPKVRPINVLK